MNFPILTLLACILVFSNVVSLKLFKKHAQLEETGGYRLPGNAKPTFYDLTFTVDFNVEKPTMQGRVVITLDVNDTKTQKVLQLNSNITFAKDAKASWLSNNDTFSCNITTPDPNYLELTCDKSITGTNQKVTIDFTPTISEVDMDGAYLVRYQEEEKSKVMIATELEQIGARKLFPCFDEPAYKAPIQLTLITNVADFNENQWISNTPVQSSSFNNTTGVHTTVFQPTPPMSTYLLAFLVCQDFVNSTANDLTGYDFSVFTRKTAANFVDIALEYAPLLIESLGRYLNLSYVSLENDKMTLAAIPEYPGVAMENWGLITFQEIYLIDEGNKTTIRDKQDIVSMIAHELSHQWFGDFVTMDWWSNTFLNEGFATYFEHYITDEVLDDVEMFAQLVTKQQQVALKDDAYPNTIPLSNNASNVTTKDDFDMEFGVISYCKGGSVLKMIRNAIGDVTFRTALYNYLNENKNGNPTPDNLIDFLEQATNSTVDLTKYLHEWIYEKGYPLLTLTLNTDNTVTLNAEKFSSSLNKTEEDNKNIWWIPLTYTTSDNLDFTELTNVTWLDPNSLSNFSITLKSGAWILANLQASGYYRVNYDATLWSRIIETLNVSPELIHVINRAQLLDDAFNLARSLDGSESELYTRAFTLAEYLKNETEYHPWYTFFVEMQYLLDRIQDEDTLAALKAKILDIVSYQVRIPKHFEDFNHLQTLKQNLILYWACKLGHDECVQWAEDQFVVYELSPNSIDNNYRDVILCTRLATSNTAIKDYAFLVNKLNTSNLPLEQTDIAKSLGCFNGTPVPDTFTLTLMDNIQFSRMMFNSILDGLINQGTEKIISTLKIVLKNDELINEKWRNIDSVENILNTIASKSFSLDIANVIQKDYIDIYEKDNNRTAIVKTAKLAIDVIKINVEWTKKFETILTSVLRP
ncbi:hypothetical protein ABEB36_006938 [Hypothenemus hampei]|uniref:Aminopeptidase n=1 Tax=Hypothenemus hampei TaxID=57062 RepID=A0ABD1EVA1_HYPHA